MGSPSRAWRGKGLRDPDAFNSSTKPRSVFPIVLPRLLGMPGFLDHHEAFVQ